MAKVVIKRGGKRETFRPEKLKSAFRAALKDIHIGGARATRMVKKAAAPVLRFMAKRKTIRASVLRQKALASLKKVEPAAVKAWLAYDKRRRTRRLAAAKKRKRR